MKKVEIKIIRDDLKEFVLDNAVWGIPSDGLDGFDAVNSEIFTENYATGDGSRIIGERVGEKDRTIKARLMNPALNEVMRKVVTSFFNPKRTYKVYIDYQGVKRWCEGKQLKFTCPNSNVYKPLEITWTILCPMPYMLSMEAYGKDIGAKLPLFGFPFWSIKGYGYGCGVSKFAKNVEIENNGDVETFLRCVIVAKADVTNPKLIKDNKYVRFIDIMHKGDVYEIDFAHRPVTVKKNGVNALGQVDRSSAISEMALDVGKTKIGFDADNGSNNMSVTIYYNQRYLGV